MSREGWENGTKERKSDKKGDKKMSRTSRNEESNRTYRPCQTHPPLDWLDGERYHGKWGNRTGRTGFKGSS